MAGLSYQLYELSARYQAVIDRIAEQDGEITEEDEKELAVTEENLSESISESYKAIKNINNVIDGLKAEAASLDQRIRKYTKIADRISENLKKCMLITGHTGKTYGNDHHYAYITYSHPIKVNEEAALESYQKPLNNFKQSLPDYIKVDISVSKKVLGKHIDAGEEFDFAVKTDNANLNLK